MLTLSDVKQDLKSQSDLRHHTNIDKAQTPFQINFLAREIKRTHRRSRSITAIRELWQTPKILPTYYPDIDFDYNAECLAKDLVFLKFDLVNVPKKYDALLPLLGQVKEESTRDLLYFLLRRSSLRVLADYKTGSLDEERCKAIYTILHHTNLEQTLKPHLSDQQRSQLLMKLAVYEFTAINGDVTRYARSNNLFTLLIIHILESEADCQQYIAKWVQPIIDAAIRSSNLEGVYPALNHFLENGARELPGNLKFIGKCIIEAFNKNTTDNNVEGKRRTSEEIVVKGIVFLRFINLALISTSVDIEAHTKLIKIAKLLQSSVANAASPKLGTSQSMLSFWKPQTAHILSFYAAFRENDRYVSPARGRENSPSKRYPKNLFNSSNSPKKVRPVSSPITNLYTGVSAL